MITMCDYYGMCDENGRCVGHPVKVTREYGEILRSLGEELRLVCSPCIADGSYGSVFREVIRLPYDISIVGNGICKRIADKFKLFKNIRLALRNKGTIFFYQVDFFFFFYLRFFYKKTVDRKLVILIYHQDFTGGKLAPALKKVYESALKKIDGVIYTQKEAAVPHGNAAWMPDFIYRADEYDKYRNAFKINRVVCLGTMSRYKQIEELIDVWRRLSAAAGTDEVTREDISGHGDDLTLFVPELLIAGRFDTNERFDALSANLPKNVTIRNDVLPVEEYMTLLSGSMYAILPYDMNQYKNRTSGVLLESIYCGVIPIAPKALLKQNRLPGIGYDDIRDLEKILVDRAGSDDGSGYGEEDKKIIAEYDHIYSEYGIEYATDVLRKKLVD